MDTAHSRITFLYANTWINNSSNHRKSYCVLLSHNRWQKSNSAYNIIIIYYYLWTWTCNCSMHTWWFQINPFQPRIHIFIFSKLLQVHTCHTHSTIHSTFNVVWLPWHLILCSNASFSNEKKQKNEHTFNTNNVNHFWFKSIFRTETMNFL